MEKEKKIVASINKMQKSLFEYKQFVKNYPTQISRDDADKLAVETAKNLYETFSHLQELKVLFMLLKPDAFDEKDRLEIRDVDKLLGGLKAMLDLHDKS